MCQVAPRPALFLAGPLQAPYDWLLFAGALVVMALIGVYTYRRYLRPLAPGAGRKMGLALLVFDALVSLTGLIILDLVAGATNDAVTSWARVQSHLLAIHRCSNSAEAAFTAAWRLAQHDLMTWSQVGLVLLGVGVGTLILFHLWVRWRTRAQSAGR